MSADNPPIVPALLRVPDVCRLVQVSRSALYKLMQTDPTFPRAVRLTARAVAWRRADLDAWIEGLPAVGATAPPAA